MGKGDVIESKLYFTLGPEFPWLPKLIRSVRLIVDSLVKSTSDEYLHLSRSIVSRCNINSYLIVALLLLLLSNSESEVFGQPVPKEITPALASGFEAAVEAMNLNHHDSAQVILNRLFDEHGGRLSLIDLYYIHSLEAEIMYYNALFEQGLNTAIRAREVALQLDNDTLIGSADNLVGLLMLSSGRTVDALPYLRSAVRLIPRNHGNGFLSANYQAIANIGECFLKLEMPDSVIMYSMASLDEAEALGKERGLGIAYWNLAEAYLIRGDLASAKSFGHRGLQVLKGTAHRDVSQAHLNTLMRACEQAGQTDSTFYFMDLGLMENENRQNTDYSRSEFLTDAIDVALRLRNVPRANAMLATLRDLERSFDVKEQGIRLEVLREYYEKSQQLAINKERMDAQSNELALRWRVQAALIAVVLLLLLLGFFILFGFRQRSRLREVEFGRAMEEERRVADLRAIEMRIGALNEERNRIASDLHDDIGASLSSIRIYSEAADMQFGPRPEEAQRLVRLVRDTSIGIMDRMGDIVWSISPRNDSGENMVFRMKSFSHQTLGAAGIDVRFKIGEGIDTIRPTIQARKNVYLIFKEAINNIAKYSGANEVLVSIALHDGKLIMTVVDNGCGFETSAAPTGNGLTNMLNRAHAIGGTLVINSQPGSGTEVVLTCDIAKISEAEMSPGA